ncbi:MAG: glutamine synthetase, partial [Pseudomonadota bacterium]
WSAGFNNLGQQDREAAIRICPVSATEPERKARQFNFEYRAADAAASPHLALAAIVIAGTMGIREGLTAPEATTEDLSLLSAAELGQRGLTPLPKDLPGALSALKADADYRRAFPPRMVDIYRAHKTGELDHTTPMTPEERYAAYASTY